ncbi:MAG: site-specific integrase [Bacteroidia bacterium]
MKTPSLKFYLKPIEHPRYSHTVILRIVYARKKAELSTKMRCKQKDWDFSKERFKNNIVFNQRLAELESKVYKCHHELEALGKFFGPKEIKHMMGEGRKPTVALSAFYGSYLEKQEKNGEVGRSTMSKYKQTYDYLLRYLESTSSDLAVRDIDFHFIAKWDDWLKYTPYNEFGDKLKTTTVNKHHSRLKAVLFEAVKQGILRQNPYVSFKLRFPQANREYLTRDELERFQDVDLTEYEIASQVRDIFLFSCYTGLRFSDAMALTMDNIAKIGEEVYLRLDQIKTRERREIPLLGPALNIIEKYSWCNDRMLQNKVLPKLSNPKVNQYLKFIAEKAKIKKRLTHHVARHTCATTVLLDNHVPLETVSHWLGHNSVRTTQIYAKISHNNLSKEVKRLNELTKLVSK